MLDTGLAGDEEEARQQWRSKSIRTLQEAKDFFELSLVDAESNEEFVTLAIDTSFDSGVAIRGGLVRRLTDA